MPIIQDPRMNAGFEKQFGVAYFDIDFEIKDVIYQAGHYFYLKDPGNPKDSFNSRYFPHGFPVVATKAKDARGLLPDQLITDTRRMFPNLVYSVVLTVEMDSDYEIDNQDGLNSRLPMAAYLHRCITQREAVPGHPQGRGLRKFNRGVQYRYRRDEGDVDVGRVEAQQE